MALVSGQTTHDDVTAEYVAEGLDPIIGLTLDGRFRVVEPLGKGAMGTVYRAVQQPLNRTVALKVLDSNYGAGRDETFRQRFLVEAALTAKLSHPNTVRIIDYGCTKDGLFYLAMEYLAGATLDRVLQHGGLPWRRVAGIGLQIARALREAHDLGVVHRDLKPANIMVLKADTDADHVKVLDFGLVKSFIEGRELEGRAITQHGMLMGSPPYMAPEQGDKNRADPRSDIYSLGVVMFEALTGSPPFTGQAPLEIILKHVNQPVPPIRAPNGVEPVAEAMVALVNKCLAKSPMDRFQSMEEVIAALQELSMPISSGPIVVTPSAEMEALRESIRPKYRTALLVGGFLAAVALGIGGTAAVLYRPPAPPVESPPSEKAPEAARPVEAAVPLEAPKAVQFHVESEPRGATVEFGGKVFGPTPVDVEVAPRPNGVATAALTLSLAGYKRTTVNASGEAGSRLVVSQALEKLPAEAETATLANVAPTAAATPVAAVTPKRTDPKRALVVREQTRKDLPKAKRRNKPAVKLDEEDEPFAAPVHAPTAPLTPTAPAEKDELKRPFGP